MSNQITWLTAEYIQKFILDPFNDNELKVKDFEISPGSSAGDGYLSQVYRIKINATKKNISIIAKVLLSNSTVDKFESSLSVYDKEKLMLQSFLPKSLTKLPKPISFFPAFYYADDAKRTLFIEDLCYDGYQLCDHNCNGLDLQHSLLIMEALAKLHATSHLIFKDDPSLTKTFEKKFYCEENRAFIENMTRQSRENLMEVLVDWNLPEEYNKKLKDSDDWVSKIMKNWERQDDRMNVLLQTDCWLNNQMFKYNENGVESAKLIDFQLGTYNSFAIDLNFFIFSSTSTNVKINHLSTLMDRYYEVLTEIAGNLPNFSKEQLWKEFHERLFIGFFTLVSTAPIIIAPAKAKPTEIDKMMDGENQGTMAKLLRNPKLPDCVEKLMPYFIQHNAL